MLRYCKICGKAFESAAHRNLCYDDHYRTCPDCGESVLWNKIEEFKGCKRCNQKRAVTARKQTMLARYGGETTLQSKQLSAKARATNLSKYGHENAMQNTAVQKKAKTTNIAKYGHENAMSNPDIAKKSAQTRSLNIDTTVEHIKRAWLEKYGVDNVSKCPEIIDKITATFLNRYGVKRAVNVPEFRQKMIDSMIDKYGVAYYTQSEAYRHHSNFRISKINKEFAVRLTDRQIAYQSEFSLGLKSYDIFLSDIQTLIEIDPTYTHNIIGNHWNTHGLSMYYHRDKTQLAEDNGYRCIHVWDWDDWDKVVDLIAPKTVLSSEDMSIYRLTPEVTNQFLEENDIHRTCRGQLVSFGLVKDEQVYQVMTFGKPKYDHSYNVQMMRMCTKRGFEITGGFDRLSHFASADYGLSRIIAYCDRSKYTGREYEQLGMKLARITPPQLVWSKDKKKITANLLRIHGYNQLFGTNYSDNADEQHMLESGWLPVYDCGQRVYVFD